MVSVLTSHQCGPGSNPEPTVISGLSLLLVLVLALRLFLWIIRLSTLHKNQHLFNLFILFYTEIYVSLILKYFMLETNILTTIRYKQRQQGMND